MLRGRTKELSSERKTLIKKCTGRMGKGNGEKRGRAEVPQ